MVVFQRAGFRTKLFTFSLLACFGVLCLALEQHMRNNDIKQSCDLKTHKLVYLASPIGDQVLCVAPNHLDLLKSSTRV